MPRAFSNKICTLSCDWVLEDWVLEDWGSRIGGRGLGLRDWGLRAWELGLDKTCENNEKSSLTFKWQYFLPQGRLYSPYSRDAHERGEFNP